MHTILIATAVIVVTFSSLLLWALMRAASRASRQEEERELAIAVAQRRGIADADLSRMKDSELLALLGKALKDERHAA